MSKCAIDCLSNCHASCVVVSPRKVTGATHGFSHQGIFFLGVRNILLVCNWHSSWYTDYSFGALPLKRGCEMRWGDCRQCRFANSQLSHFICWSSSVSSDFSLLTIGISFLKPVWITLASDRDCDCYSLFLICTAGIARSCARWLINCRPHSNRWVAISCAHSSLLEMRSVLLFFALFLVQPRDINCLLTFIMINCTLACSSSPLILWLSLLFCTVNTSSPLACFEYRHLRSACECECVQEDTCNRTRSNTKRGVSAARVEVQTGKCASL